MNAIWVAMEDFAVFFVKNMTRDEKESRVCLIIEDDSPSVRFQAKVMRDIVNKTKSV